MRIDNDIKLDFDDVLIRPKRSDAPSRSVIDLERENVFLHSNATWKGMPLIASNMDTVGTMAMARALAPGMLTCLHKHHAVDDLVTALADDSLSSAAFLTIGVNDEEFETLRRVADRVPLSHVCVDVANGYTRFFVDHVRRVRDSFPHLTVMAGNVATPEMVQELLITGAADIVKIGIGPGSVCTTRLTTGVGYPQLSAIIECADAAHGLKGHVCADGGCRTPSDVVKALAAGADFVMLGGMLAGHDECEGRWITEDGRKVGFGFYGMASEIAMEKYSGGHRGYRAREGRETIVPYRGAVAGTLQEVTGGLRSACAYVGASSLKDLSKCTTFIMCRRVHGALSPEADSLRCDAGSFEND